VQIIVHGGAGSAPDEPDARQAVLDRAADDGAVAATPLDAVETAVGVLEASPRFNAGTGGAVQSDGVIRTDAGVMTSDREAGAACSMPGVERALNVARVVAEETPHVLVSGDHAVALAEEFGVETDVDLWTDRTRERWEAETPPQESPGEQLPWIHEHYGDTEVGRRDTLVRDENVSVRVEHYGDTEVGRRDPSDHDTVGAVATDGDRIVAATSTGGRWYALAGRVGDVPQIGAGFFATDAGGASATGNGEAIATTSVSRRAVQRLDAGDDPQSAADAAIEAFADRTHSSAGVIVADGEGRVGSAYNSEAMQTSAAGVVD
jgi:beta-aspartyl-peptidase (threonine type)